MTTESPVSQSRVCWICLGDEIDPESVDSGPFVKLCSCTLQAHENCLLQWMLASHKPTPTCPQCGTKFVAVKKRQGVSLVVHGARRILAFVAFVGVSFVVFRSVGSVYVRALYEPVDADRIIGTLPIPGLSQWANTVVKTFNSVVMSAIPYVLLRASRSRESIPEQAVEPPLLSLAMMLVARLEPKPIGWASLSFAGLAHSAYRLTMDTFIMPRFGNAPLELPEVPALPAILNLGRDPDDEDMEDIELLNMGERVIGRDMRRASAQLSHMLGHSHRISDLMSDVVYTVTHNIIRDRYTPHEDPRLHERQDTPNESDASESDYEDPEEVHTRQYHAEQVNGPRENEPHNANQRNELPPQNLEDAPLLPESHVLTLFLVVNSERTPDDFQDWSNDYLDLVRSLVDRMRASGMSENLNDLVKANVWKMVYWQPIRFLATYASRDERNAVLLHSDVATLNTLTSLASSDDVTWNCTHYEDLLEGNTPEGLAEYVCEWIQHRRDRIHDPLHDVLVNELINGIAEVDAEAAILLRDQNRRPGDLIPEPDNANVDTSGTAELISGWEKAAPIIFFPFCSILVSKGIHALWPFSILTTMNRNLIAGGLIIIANDLIWIAFARIQHMNHKKWYLTRFDNLDEDTRRMVQMQQNPGVI